MCDPVSMLVGAVAGSVGGKLLGGGGGGGSSTGNAEAERMKAEADAATSANQRLAMDQKRRREQQSLIARGAPGGVGEQPGTGDSPLSTAQTVMRQAGSRFRDAPDISQSLIARGAGQLNPAAPATPTQPNRRKTIGGY